MNDDREVSPDMAALLGALADDRSAGPEAAEAAIGDGERARLEAELGSLELRQALASHRALVGELRALPERAPSPDWRALEASIRRACDEVPAPRRWSWAGLRELWRWPAVGMGAAVMAGLALLLWQRAPRPVEPAMDAATDAAATAAAPMTPAPRDAGAATDATPIASAPLYLDEETLEADEIDEAGVNELMRQLPAGAAIALGAAEPGEGAASDDDADELERMDTDELLLPGDSFDDELERMDAEALRALDQWLEAEQKG